MKNYITIDSVINDYLSLSKRTDEINTADIKYEANRVLRKLIDVYQLVPKIGLFEIRDYKIQKPDDFVKIVQMAYKPSGTKKVETYEIVGAVVNNFPKSGCDIKITKECDDCLDDDYDCNCDSRKMVVNIDRLWDLSHPEFRYNHMQWFYRHGGLANGPIVRSSYHNEFQLIRNTQDPYFAIETHIKGCLNLIPQLKSCETQYRVDNEVFRYNVKDGQILLSYLARPVDSKGYLMVPNSVDVFDAIRWTIEANYRYQLMGMGDATAPNMFAIAESKRLEAMGRARAKLRERGYEQFWSELGKYFGKHLPVEDGRGNVTDYYTGVMDRLTRM